MPIRVPAHLPAIEILNRENVFIMDETRAMTQDIRPLRIVILNLMPNKIATETQLLRLIGNSPLQVDVRLIQTASHVSKNTPSEHLLQFYQTWADIRELKFDGMIITGAPVELLEFERVDYWPELCEIMEWSKTNVFSTFHICWGAQAALYYHYDIPKYALPAKMFGVFEHNVLDPSHYLMHGLDEVFFAPHSRHTEVREADINAEPRLRLLSVSRDAGAYIAASRDCRQFFVMGHSEYDRDSLAGEYFRDLGRGLPISVPANYFPGGDPAQPPKIRWRAHANLLYLNWLNYFVYQSTPYDYLQH